jgi:hypothetical protein
MSPAAIEARLREVGRLWKLWQESRRLEPEEPPIEPDRPSIVVRDPVAPKPG